MASDNLQTSPCPTTRRVPPASALRSTGAPAASSSGPASGRSAEGMQLLISEPFYLGLIFLSIYHLLDYPVLGWPGAATVSVHGLPPRVNSDDSSSNHATGGDATKDKKEKKKNKAPGKSKKGDKKSKTARDDDDTEDEIDASHEALGGGDDGSEDRDDSDALGSDIPGDLRGTRGSKKKPAAKKAPKKKPASSRGSRKRADDKERFMFQRMTFCSNK